MRVSKNLLQTYANPDDHTVAARSDDGNLVALPSGIMFGVFGLSSSFTSIIRFLIGNR